MDKHTTVTNEKTHEHPAGETSKADEASYFEWMMDEYIGNVYISDIDTYELLYVNKASCETIKIPAEALVGRPCYEVIQQRTSPCPFCTNHLLCTEKFYEWEYYNPSLERIFMIKNRLINWNGRRARLELSHDMYSTEFKLAKKDRERDVLIRSIPGGFARVDARDYNTILWYGSDFLNILEYTAEQFRDELHCQCGYIHPEDADRIRAALRKIKTTGESIVLEGRIITRSGKIKVLTLTLCYASAEDSWDGIPSFYSIGIDITKDRQEQLRQQKALEDAYRSARMANDAKTDFLSAMSHDIRTPMNAIMGMTEIAQANLSSPEKIRDCLKKIKVSGNHLLGLINEVLDMSIIESGKIELLSQTVNLPGLMQNVYDMCRPLIEEKQHRILPRIKNVKHENIITDGERLQQVFANVLSNAIKYTPDGGEIAISIREYNTFNPQKGRYEFIFEDNGIGMSEEFIPRIFEPFSRAEDSRINKIQGTGLGMAITENIIRMMNGTIDVKSRPGAGSRFTISVEFDFAGDEEFVNHELTGLPVLVIDENPEECQYSISLLDKLKMKGCEAAPDAESISRAALIHGQEHDFFAVILGHETGGRACLETIKILRSVLGEKIPLIILSPSDDAKLEKDCLYAGASAFITRPLFKSKLLHVLQLFSSGSAAGDDTGAQTVLPGKRILLVEDNELNSQIAAELLKMQKILVETATNGQEAVDKFSLSPTGYYDAILMDIQMPVMNGYDATQTIRRMDRTDAASVPILALTANAFTSDIGKAYSAGMSDYITKPLDLKRMIAVLEKWLLR